MHTETIFEFKKMLKNMDTWLAKGAAYADAKKIDVNILAAYRLAPDMFPLNRQVQSACDAAKFCAAYLAGQTPPKHPDTETTWPELRERIKKVITYLETFKEGDFNKADKIKPGWAEGKYLTATEYTYELAMPNFFFHAAMTYAILRHAGVDVGKEDFLGELALKG